MTEPAHAAAREPRRGREARRSARAKASLASIPYITRKIPLTELLSEEGLEAIERNAETLFEEIGVDFRDFPRALDLFRGAASRASGCAFRAAWRGGSAPPPPRNTSSTRAIPSAMC
jgi:trimethylamine---corrinoid protein Co-methyltransferase